MRLIVVPFLLISFLPIAANSQVVTAAPGYGQGGTAPLFAATRMQESDPNANQAAVNQPGAGSNDFFQQPVEQPRTANDFIWEDETLPDWMEDLGLEEYDGQSLPVTPTQSDSSAGDAPKSIPNPYGSCSDPLRCRPTLTGDWRGRRTCMQQNGITFRGSSTHFAFGVAGGINVSPIPFGLALEQGDTFEYTGRGEYDFIFDLEKFGGMPHGKMLVGFQHFYGEYGNVSFNTGGFAPAVFGATLPPTADDPGVPFVTDFLWTQPLSEGLIVFAGKKNVVGTADQDIFAGGDGTDQFVNQALVANPAYLLGLPYSSFTMGFVMPRKWGSFNAYIYDPQDRTEDFFRLKDLFSEGVIFGTQLKVNTNFRSLPGEHHIGGLWKHLDQLDLRFQPQPPTYPYNYPPVQPGLATLDDAYTIYYGFDQYVRVLPGNRPGALPNKRPRGWGFFGRASISDGNPTPLDYFLSAGIGGDCRTACDRGDTWGIGWYHVGTTGEYGPLPGGAFGPREGGGVELYYNIKANPWLNITPDIQFIRPGLGGLTSGDDAFVYGLRVNMKL